jgi:hypothetical protein
MMRSSMNSGFIKQRSPKKKIIGMDGKEYTEADLSETEHEVCAEFDWEGWAPAAISSEHDKVHSTSA